MSSNRFKTRRLPGEWLRNAREWTVSKFRVAQSGLTSLGQQQAGLTNYNNLTSNLSSEMLSPSLLTDLSQSNAQLSAAPNPQTTVNQLMQDYLSYLNPASGSGSGDQEAATAMKAGGGTASYVNDKWVPGVVRSEQRSVNLIMTVPEWLNVNPSSFVQAREAGDQMGLQRARLGQEGALESARINQQGALAMAQLHQSAAQAAASLAQKQQELEAGQKQTAVEFQAAQETAKQNFMLRQTQDAVLNAYRQAQIGLGKQRVQQAAQKIQQATAEKAQGLADRQNYAMAVASGMTPAEALAKYPLAWTPALAQAATKPGPEQTVTQHFKEVEGKDADVTPGGTRAIYNPMRYLAGKDYPAVTNAPAVEGHPAYSVTQKMPAGTSPMDAFRAAQPAPTAADVQPAPSTPGLPKQGDIVNGYVFKGGDPADQKNWIEAPATPDPIAPAQSGAEAPPESAPTE